MQLSFLLALMATLLCVGIGVHAWRTRSPGLACLAAWFCTLAAAAWLLGLVGPPGAPRPPQARTIIVLLNLLAGASLFAYVSHALRGRLPGAWTLAPLALALVLTALYGAGIVQWFDVRDSIVVEWGYTAAALVLFARDWRLQGSRLPPHLPVFGVLSMIVTLHAGQAAVMLFGAASPLINLLPVAVMALWLAGVISLALVQTPLLGRLAASIEPGPSPEDEALFARLEVVMRDARPWTDPDFELATLASAVRSHPNAVSRALTRAGGTTFYDYLNAFRVREAERLLLDPSEARYKVEALGRQAGFKARSTFFKAFRAYTGLTPAEFRRQRLPASQPEPQRRAS